MFFAITVAVSGGFTRRPFQVIRSGSPMPTRRTCLVVSASGDLGLEGAPVLPLQRRCQGATDLLGSKQRERGLNELAPGAGGPPHRQPNDWAFWVRFWVFASLCRSVFFRFKRSKALSEELAAQDLRFREAPDGETHAANNLRNETNHVWDISC